MFLDASRCPKKANGDQWLVVFGTHVGPFSERGRYATSDDSITVVLLVGDLRNPRTERKSELETSIPKRIPTRMNIASLGSILDAFASLGPLLGRLWRHLGSIGIARVHKQAIWYSCQAGAPIKKICWIMAVGVGNLVAEWRLWRSGLGALWPPEGVRVAAS